MLKSSQLFFLLLGGIITGTAISQSLPPGFVYLHDIAPGISQDIRYATSNNFLGHPVPGYDKETCILSKEAAMRLKSAQLTLKNQGYDLKVYDCYRPKKAVRAFYDWSLNKHPSPLKPYFFPREKKIDLFKKGYIAKYSGHSRGSTVDLTMIRQNQSNQHPTVSCFGKHGEYNDDASLDMGTRYDCLDKSAHIHYKELTKKQKKNRQLLRRLMSQHGFRAYQKEWWHFTLRNEPFPRTYFDFDVR